MIRRRLIVQTAMSLALAVMCTPAHAQIVEPVAPAPPNASAEEIVVTAQRRTQVLADVPQSGVEFGPVNATLFAKNVFNSRGLTDAGGFGTRPGGAVAVSPIRRRTLGVTVGFAF